MNQMNDGGSEQSAMLLKILTIGDTAVGKTCLIMQFSEGGFQPSFITTVGIDYKRKIVKLDDQKFYKLTIWDTAGQERFRTITHAYFRGSHGMLLVFDVGARKTFENIKHWMDQIHAHTKNQVDSPPPKVVLIGNKCDLPAAQRQVTQEEAQKCADEAGIPYVETSAKDNINVQEAFMTVTRLVSNSGMLGRDTDRTVAKTLSDSSSAGNGGGSGCAC